jgi:hypothetical protein
VTQITLFAAAAARVLHTYDFVATRNAASPAQAVRQSAVSLLPSSSLVGPAAGPIAGLQNGGPVVVENTISRMTDGVAENVRVVKQLRLEVHSMNVRTVRRERGFALTGAVFLLGRARCARRVRSPHHHDAAACQHAKAAELRAQAALQAGIEYAAARLTPGVLCNRVQDIPGLPGNFNVTFTNCVRARATTAIRCSSIRSVKSQLPAAFATRPSTCGGAHATSASRRKRRAYAARC